jgi:hypothetical protein
MIFAKWKEGSNFSLSDMRQVVTSLKVDELRKRAAGLLSKEVRLARMIVLFH